MSTSFASERPLQLKYTMLAPTALYRSRVFDSRLRGGHCPLSGVKDLPSDILTNDGCHEEASFIIHAHAHSPKSPCLLNGRI